MRIISLFFLLFLLSGNSGNNKMPDLLEIKCAFWSTKGRVQDMNHLPTPVIDQLVSLEKSSIPYLINRLKSKKKAKPGVVELWPYVEERHLAILILYDFFIDPSCSKTALPLDLHLENLIEIERYPDLAIWDIFYTHVDDEKWKSIINKWTIFWEKNKKLLFWDDAEKFFKIKGIDLHEVRNF